MFYNYTYAVKDVQKPTLVVSKVISVVYQTEFCTCNSIKSEGSVKPEHFWKDNQHLHIISYNSYKNILDSNL